MNGLAQAPAEPRETIHVDHTSVFSPSPRAPAVLPAAQVEADKMAALAACLFDLRAACETQLCTLTSMQRHLERVRRLGSHTPEADLLLTEIARQLRELETGGLDVAHCHGVAERTFRQIRQE